MILLQYTGFSTARNFSPIIDFATLTTIVLMVYYDRMIMLIQPSSNKWYLTVTAIVFTVMAIAHLAVIVLQLPATVGAYTVPYEINGLVVVVLGYLATRGFMAAHRL